MEFKFNNLQGEEVEVSIGAGRVVYVIGANGSGKSGLILKVYAENKDIARRISAHRQTWFQSNAMDMTAHAKKSTQDTMASHDVRANARWMDPMAQQRASVTVFELVDAENVRARKITDAVDRDDMEKVRELKKEESPLTILNELLKVANLPIEISIENDEQLFARKEGGDPYSIAELSDGERNAILIAANVLTAKKDSLIIIDEPERHLHRSIVSPLLLSLFEKREDCGFVISTHDVSLSVDCPESSTLLLRSCTWANNVVVGWDSDILLPEVSVPDDVKTSILGARRKMLFVEGERDSLDRHIYSILYPSISVWPSGNCIDVERAVTGIRNSAELHWVSAFGLIDRDDRNVADVQALAGRGIFALDCYSVESLYYCDVVIDNIAARQAQIAEGLADQAAAKKAVIDHAVQHRDRLCEKRVVQRARVAITCELPTRESLQQNPLHTVSVDTAGLLAAEQATFDALVAANNNDGLVSRYPLRETGALGGVATSLGFKDRKKYEAAARKLLIENSDARDVVKQKMAELTAAIGI